MTYIFVYSEIALYFQASIHISAFSLEHKKIHIEREINTNEYFHIGFQNNYASLFFVLSTKLRYGKFLGNINSFI